MPVIPLNPCHGTFSRGLLPDEPASGVREVGRPCGG